MPGHDRGLTAPGQRLRLRHLFVAVSGAAVLFAVLAALVRGSSTKIQLSAFGQSVVLVLMILGCIGFVFHKRQQVELRAGLGIEHFGRRAGRVLNWIVLASFFGFVVLQPALKWHQAKPGEIVNLLPSPWILFMVVNYTVGPRVVEDRSAGARSARERPHSRRLALRSLERYQSLHLVWQRWPTTQPVSQESYGRSRADGRLVRRPPERTSRAAGRPNCTRDSTSGMTGILGQLLYSRSMSGHTYGSCPADGGF